MSIDRKRKLPCDDDLKTLFFEWGLEYKDIANIYNCCSQLVDSRFRKMGYRKGHWKIPNDNTLYELLSDNEKTFRQMAKELGINPATLSYHARRLGFSRGQKINPLPPDEVLVRLHCDERKSIREIATEYHVGEIRTRGRLERIGKLRDHRDQWDEVVRRRRVKKYNGREPTTYLYTSVSAPGHHRANSAGYLHYHILVAEKKLGRPLKDGEIVHHIDMIRGNNDASNLYICKNRYEHNAIHASLELIAAQLYAEGVVGFKDGEYYIKRKNNPMIRQVQGPKPTLPVLEKWLSPPELKECLLVDSNSTLER